LEYLKDLLTYGLLRQMKDIIKFPSENIKDSLSALGREYKAKAKKNERNRTQMPTENKRIVLKPIKRNLAK
jgi:hypothetical protein